MCAPAVVAMGVATAASAGASIYAQQRQASFEAGLADNNAMLAAKAGDERKALAADRAAGARAQGAKAAAAAQAQLAGGIDTTSGVGADILATSHIVAAEDAAMIKANAAKEAWGFAQQSRDLAASGKARRTAGVLGGVTTGLNATAKLIGGAS